MYIFDRYSPYSYQNNREKYKNDDEKREFTLKECLWFCMTSLTPRKFFRNLDQDNTIIHFFSLSISEGGGEAPKNLSGRLVAATWWLFG
jgi:ionotropic glutamate receptor